MNIWYPSIHRHLLSVDTKIIFSLVVIWLQLNILQIRGSIPLLWEQIVDLSYKPHISIISHDQTVHFYFWVCC